MNKKKIMVVDDNVTNLNIARKALEGEYEVVLLLNGAKALKILEKKQARFDFIRCGNAGNGRI